MGMFNEKEVHLGIAPIGWCNDDMPELGGENTFQQIVSEMALAGFTGCEIGNKYPTDPEELKKAQEFAKDLESKSVTVGIKVGTGGKTFGSVSTKEIADAAKKQLGIDIDKKKMVLASPLRELGETQVPVKVHPKVTANLKVIVKEI